MFGIVRIFRVFVTLGFVELFYLSVLDSLFFFIFSYHYFTLTSPNVFSETSVIKNIDYVDDYKILQTFIVIFFVGL